MNKQGKRILIILGGIWHDFDGFAEAMRSIFEQDGYHVTATYDLHDLEILNEIKPDIVLSYTGLSPHREGYDDQGPEALTSSQVNGLQAWVNSGGRLLGVHCATVAGGSPESFRSLFGGIFLSHPAPFSFTVFPLITRHPIISEVEAFNVFDEFYIQDVDSSVDVHMVTVDRMKAYPMVWTKNSEMGRVAYIAMGHYSEIWEMPAYQRLIRNAAGWLLAS